MNRSSSKNTRLLSSVELCCTPHSLPTPTPPLPDMNTAVKPETTVNFGLSEEQMELILSKCLKPEEIAGTPEQIQDRVHELLHWFARLGQNRANPKWTFQHAMELAYYIASNAINQHLDLSAVRCNAYSEGVVASEKDRQILKNHTDLPFEPPLKPEDYAGRLDRLERGLAQMRQLLAEKTKG